MKEIELIYPHLGHSLRALRRTISQCKSMREVRQVLESYGINLLYYPPFEGSIVNGFVKPTAKGNLALIISNLEKKGESLMPVFMHLLGDVQAVSSGSSKNMTT